MYNKKYSFQGRNIVLQDVKISLKSPLFLRDIDTVERHIKGEDYFGTLATIVSLLDQTGDNLTVFQKKILRELKNDLMHLEKNYKIVKK